MGDRQTGVMIVWYTFVYLDLQMMPNHLFWSVLHYKEAVKGPFSQPLDLALVEKGSPMQGYLHCLE